MSVYLDTSVWVKLYLPEAGSDAFERWLRNADDPKVSSLGVVELHSALGRLLRAGMLDASQVGLLRQRIAIDLEEGLVTLVGAGDEQHRRAAHMLVECPTPLRALDALHLAACLSVGATQVATADRAQSKAAAWLGLGVVDFSDDRR